MLKTFLDKHKGKIGFVLGAGPSLREVDVELLKPHVVIAVNSSILKAPFAQYFFTCDANSSLFSFWATLKDLECMLILNSNLGKGMDTHKNQTGVSAFEGIAKKRVFYFSRKSGWKVEKSDRLLMGISSIHCAVHFAHILGCSPIVLLGCDCQSKGGKNHFYDFSSRITGGPAKPEWKSFVTSDYIRKGSKYVFRTMLAGWKKLKQQNPEVAIINASDGQLNEFIRMTLGEALLRFGK